jgi:type IV pilus assembly protein PilO
MRFGIRELLFCLVLLGLPVAALIFVFQPSHAQIQQVQQENQAKRKKLADLELARHIEDLGQEITRLTEEIDRFEAKLPTEEEIDVVVREVWQLATQRGLSSRSVRTRKTIVGPSYLERPIDMRISGDFDGFYAFLLDLERLSRITRIHDMHLKKLSASGIKRAGLDPSQTDGYIQADFTLSIFYESADRPGNQS